MNNQQIEEFGEALQGLFREAEEREKDVYAPFDIRIDMFRVSLQFEQVKQLGQIADSLKELVGR